jgi:hypothetical protein
MGWRGEREPRSKPERAQQFERADRVVVEAFADLHEARRLRSNPAIRQVPCNGSSVRLGIG